MSQKYKKRYFLIDRSRSGHRSRSRSRRRHHEKKHKREYSRDKPKIQNQKYHISPQKHKNSLDEISLEQQMNILNQIDQPQIDDSLIIEEQRKKRQQLSQQLKNETLKESEQIKQEDGNFSDKFQFQEKHQMMISQDLEFYKSINQIRKEFDCESQEIQNLNPGQESSKDEEIFDMFGENSGQQFQDTLKNTLIHTSQLDWDDEDQRLRVQMSEVLNQRYQITTKETNKKGVFSTVVLAVDIKTQEKVAIKILRANDIFLRSGEKEKEIINLLNQNDPNNNKHIIRLIDSFEYRKHLCLVFEQMDRDLREQIKVLGRRIGLPIDLVKSYAKQIFVALAHTRKNKIIHADRKEIYLVKPDNILSCNNNKIVKVCDFGTALSFDEANLVDYMQSRYYRAPEIILGSPYDAAIDMWSAACTIYEIYTGNILFQGKNNNDMLKLMMALKGRFSYRFFMYLRILKKGFFSNKYFDNNFNFFSQEIDPVTKQEYVKTVQMNDKPINTFAQFMNIDQKSIEDQKIALQLADLLEKALTLDPIKRLLPEDALKHPFINPYNQLQKL